MIKWNFLVQVTYGCAPLLGAYFGTNIEFFQWTYPPKIQALFWCETEKPKTVVHDLASPISRVRIWILQKLAIPS